MKSKRYTRLLIVAVILLTPTIAHAYDPPTDDELVGWFNSLSRDEQVEQLRLLDRVEHETPTVDVPEYNVVVTADEVILDPRAPLEIHVAHLGWAITLPEQRAPYDPEKPNRLMPILASAGAGLVLGVIAVTLLH